jgi:hypothetical protein
MAQPGGMHHFLIARIDEQGALLTRSDQFSGWLHFSFMQRAKNASPQNASSSLLQQGAKEREIILSWMTFVT